MTYELAKRLKDAGFPQGKTMSNPMSKARGVSNKPLQKLLIHYPTLSELIEACGERFGSLGRDWLDEVGQFWCAIDRGREETVPPRIECTGPTPEVAVGKLLLALNEKSPL